MFLELSAGCSFVAPLPLTYLSGLLSNLILKHLEFTALYQSHFILCMSSTLST